MPSQQRLAVATPVEIRMAAGLVAGAGAVFLLLAVLRWALGEGASVLTLPLLLFLLGGLAGVLLRAGTWACRAVAAVVAVLGGVLHLLIVLGDGSWWTRVVSAVVAGAYVFCLVLLNTAPARGYRRNP
ncbi:MAG TPA: hypothetical protein VIL00_14430 [Pseudonocardiaceae bacterium]